MIQHLRPVPTIIQHPPIFGFPRKVLTNWTGHRCLWDFYNTYQGIYNQAVVLDFSEMEFFEGNISALLLAMVDRLKTKNGIHFTTHNSRNADCTDLLLRNGLIALLADDIQEVRADHQQSTIQARLFQVDQSDEYAEYIENQLLQHRSLHGIPNAVKEWVLANFFMEAFTNVEMHAGTTQFTTCGQFFPGRKSLRFTFCDLGNGFWEKIRDYTADHVVPVKTPKEAIEWAVSGGSTFRDKGGSALHKLRKHCLESAWGLSIATDGHLWQLKPNHYIEYRPMETAMVGTTIHLTIKTL